MVEELCNRVSISECESSCKNAKDLHYSTQK